MQATVHDALLRLIAEVIPDSANTLAIELARRGGGGEFHGAPFAGLQRAAKPQCREVLVNTLIVLEMSIGDVEGHNRKIAHCPLSCALALMRACQYIPARSGKFDRSACQTPSHSRNDRPDWAALSTVLA